MRSLTLLQAVNINYLYTAHSQDKKACHFPMNQFLLGAYSIIARLEGLSEPGFRVRLWELRLLACSPAKTG